ncbi:MAG: hypothetical protein GY845_25525 [Planctomycetes bacterium]|nr:hypothetical protein [Planctomycetota bacterium]
MAWQKGCIFDAWNELFDFDKWMQSFDECGIDPMSYVGERELDKVLPWDHIDTGVSLEFLKREYARAIEEEETADCRDGSCSGCGLQRWEEGCKGRHAKTQG